ncbi:MAG: alkaline phosphatase, partial [Deferrisomatales bacterium]
HAALAVLARDPEGFFLLVEQGDLDWASHRNDYPWTLAAVHDLHRAVEAAVAFVDQPGDALDWTNTLLLVTSDHGTGHLRLVGAPLGPGELPRADEVVKAGQAAPAGAAPRVAYGTTGHTGELVSLYARGAAAGLFAAREGAWYPGTRILDNTQLHEVMAEFAFTWAPEP